MSEQHLFCFGLGYSAGVLAQALLRQGWRVAGTARTPARVAALADAGIEAFVFDRGHPLADAKAALAGATHLLSSVPPDPAGDAVLDHHGADIAVLRELAWVGYLSTTGVYGDRAGGLVDEETPPAPTSERGKRRVDAEAGWQTLGQRHGLPVHIFRLAGIYGPGRSALDAVRAGTARRVDKPGQLFSRIHVEDIAAVLAASLRQPRAGAIYNLADDLPAAGSEVVAYACRLLGVEPPPLVALEQAALSPMAASFYGESRRVGNERIKRELGITLSYPDYSTGLAAILAAEDGAGSGE
ncbi:MAG TPA: SDR family oxidoreductase, partial [Thermoanaerobaculia bacterium]|nr:SDR family oxidoreductase [Thermoanaerobaculia bacterium]